MELPTGTVTFLFTDIEGSTKLLQELGDAYGTVQDDHMRLMREAIAAGGGTELHTEGDSFFAVFPSAGGAVQAAVAAQRALHAHRWSHGEPIGVRMGMHTGEGRLGGDDYLGIDVNRAARIAAAGHGGQVLVSEPPDHSWNTNFPAEFPSVTSGSTASRTSSIQSTSPTWSSTGCLQNSHRSGPWKSQRISRPSRRSSSGGNGRWDWLLSS